MSKKFRSTIALILLAVMVIGLIPPFPVSAASDTSAVGEVVDSYVTGSKTFTLSASSRIFVIADTEPTGDLLQTVQLIGRQFQADGRPTSAAMDIVWGPESWVTDGDIVILMDAASGVASEGYKLEVGTTAKVTASDVRGLIYGANMLQKHLRFAGSNSIQGFTASDVPDTVQRAVSLDCGRKYYTKDWICNFIREMSWMGYNTLQFHFSDDSGFRFDLWDEAYYQGQFQPKNDFSWVCGSNYTSWTLSAYKNDADKGKYLTTAEVVEILQTAAEYHIEVIPCFDSPSHLDYMTWTFEQNYDSDPDYSFYSTYDDKTYYAKDVNGIINYTNSRDWSTDLKWPYYSAVDVTGDLAKAFIFELYIDIANFFKEYSGSTHMSVGADEVQLNTANISSSYSYAWGFPEFVSYINELNTLLNSMGYTMRMYNDFLGSTAYNASNYSFADNIQIQYWDSPFNPSSSTPSNHTEPVSYYVDEGRIIYNCIQTGTYYALRKTSSGSDARSVDNRQWTFYHANEEDIWDEWYSADISEHGDYSEDVADVPAANLGGAYFLIWCDYACVSTEKEIWNGCYDTSGSGEYYSLRDRMWSNITKQWNWDINDTLSFTDFCTVRDAYGDHPGIGTTTDSCSEPTLLPAATQIKSGYAGGCTSYDAYGEVAVTASTPVMSLPCDSSTEATSSVLETAGSGDVYTAIGIYENTVSELWYKVITKTGVVGHILASNTRYVADLTDDITLTGATYPSGHVVGNYFLVRGDIAATRNTLTSVAVYIHEGFGLAGTKLTGASDTVTGNAYTLLYSAIDNNTDFGSLTAGQYTYTVSADYATNYVADGAVVSKSGTVYLMEKCFIALDAAVDQSSCSHSYSETVLYEATCTAKGTKVYACGTCGYVYEEEIAFGGHSYESETIDATCQEYEQVRYYCLLCGDSYIAYPDDLYSDWQTTKPEGVAEALIQTKTQYHYSDYETTTSTSAALEGWTQTGSKWVASSTGKVQYVNSWPSGFSTTSSLYTQYDNKADKVTASETETTKRAIDSDAIGGYLYYHWCYSNSYFSTSYKTGSYTTFHAYYSTTNPSSYQCDTSDMSYCTNHSSCSNSDWFFVANVYTQSYTDYDKHYTYERWTDWSDWSDTAYTASATRKVESQTLYRYVDGEYAAHTYDESGVCTLCGASCPHSYQNNVCVDCGLSKPQYDYYLFGWINGANYACEENAAELGDYKFVDGQVVVFFTEDSYVGVKASDNASYYMTDGWQGYVSSVTLYNTAKLSTADKLFVPGGTEVTFTLTDNGDDTYQLSYVAVECDHASHTTEGVCTVCGDAVEHAYGTSGFCVCGLECAHEMQDGKCTVCGKECAHTYQNNVCTVCGMAKPQYDYYLFGYINGANYACEEDYANLGEYKFVDGKLEVRFDADSYVAVKASDNEHWYMTAGWQGNATSVTLYNTTTLSNADKLYVPGGKLVTFTLVDNGDDTYVLSYEAACPHDSHSTDGICASCGETVLHSYQNNVCTICGYEKPALDYYLFGWINGADYADKDDSANLGQYKFVDGTLEAFFTVDSYVGVKSSDNLSWYVTDGYQEGKTSVTLYNAESIATDNKLFVPANKIVTFTLVDNGDDTYVLSYVAVDCPHESHSAEGICALCGGTVEHTYVDGVCACGKECSHSYSNGACTICGIACAHNWRNGVCQICSMSCGHSWTDGVCSICSVSCKHSWVEGECSTCGSLCDHSWTDGVCDTCGVRCAHTYQNNICTNCGYAKPATDYYLSGTINGEDYAWGTDAANLGELKFVDGSLTVTFRQDSYIALKAANNSGWYMTEGDQGQATSVVLYNAAKVTDGQLLWVPGRMEITFTLVDNGDDTLTLSYTAVACDHDTHDQSGACTACGTVVEHSCDSVVTAPTCTADGYTTHTCTVCGYSYTDTVVAATGHSYESVKIDATCTVDGSIVYTCHCGDTYTEVISATGHSYESVTTQPTCTEEGKTVYTCHCGDSYTDTIPATGHSYESVVTAPTCTKEGYTTHTCTVCGDTYTDSIVAALGHSYESVVTAPTCTEGGYTTTTCSVCGDSDVSDETAALGHSWVDPNCTEPKTCSVCGYTEGEALGHDYEAVVTAPTCTDQGKTVYTCHCGDSYTETISATGHSYETVVTEPTCTEEGYTTHTCSVCGDSYTDSQTAATGHSYEMVKHEATCTEYADYEFICGSCGDSYIRHAEDYMDWMETIPEDMDPALFESKTEYRYSDYEQLTSYETSMEGFQQTGSQWVASGSGSVAYVTSWPSGFQTTHALYSQYNNESSKVTAYETETEKLEIDSDAVVGYIWYHWCYSGYPYSVSTQQGSYNRFHAFYSTTETPANANDFDPNDDSYRVDASTECSDCIWYWPIEVYEQKHTTYDKLFTYERWTEWSDWSETEVTASETRKVESRTLYRLKDVALADHDYESVVTAPTCTADGFTTHTCKACGDICTDNVVAAPGHTWVDATCTGSKYCSVCGETDGEALGHSYETVVTAPTCTEGGYTTFTCTVCGHSYVGDETAALGHDWTDATCTAAKTCTACGETEGQALSHSYESVVTPPECTRNGYTTYTCTLCGYSYETDYVTAQGHTFDSVVTAPTCTQEGYTTHTCTTCGYVHTNETVAATGHTWTEATCTAAKTCSVCGDTEGEALGHSYETVVTAPTCTEAGYTTYTCTACGDSYVADETAALGHTWTDATCTEAKTCTVCGETEGEALGHSYESVVTAPTCTEAGYTTYTCTVCDDSYVADETAALGHTWTDATCTEAKTCTVCGETEGEALGHSYEAVVTAPTCTAGGYTTYTCSVCGDSYVADETAALGHTWTDATCTQAKTCTVCGETEGEALGHSYESVVTAPTCTAGGYTTYTCSVCGDSYVADETAALGHTWTDATCTEAKTCTVCGETEGEALGHSYESVVTAPTCTAGGYTTYTCSVCGDSYVADETAALGHTWTDATCTEAKTCTVCGETEGEALGHSYESVVTAPTCIAGGYTTYTCSVCGDSYVADETAALGHTWTDATCTQAKTCTVCGETEGEALGHSYESVVTAPTCTAGGYTTYTCSVCGDSYVADETAALGHTWTDATCTEAKTCTVCGETEGEALGHSYESVVTAPTCTAGGYTTYTCSVCGDSYVADETAALGHTWTDATCTQAKTCTVCGETEGEALGHSYESVVTAPTCTAGGYTTYTCSVCGDSYVADETDALGHTWTDGMCGTCGTACDHDYVDGICSICGSEEPVTVVDPGLSLSYPTLSFEDEIFYNVYFTVGDTSSIVEMGLMLLPSRMADATIEDAIGLVPGYVTNGMAYMVRSEGVAAAYMGDTVYFKVYAKLSDGTYAYSGAGGYNAKAYANTVLSGDYTDEMKSLVVAMVNYGAEAQLYFGHNTTALVNGSLTEEQKALVSAYDETMMDAVVAADSSKFGMFTRVNSNFKELYPSVSFDSAFSINFYCTPAIPVDGTMTLYYWNAEDYASIGQFTMDNATGSMEMTVSAAGQYWGQVSGIAAKEMDKTYYVSCVFESEGEVITTGIIAYSLGSYCESKAATVGDAQQTFAQATAVYGYYAKQYFASIA